MFDVESLAQASINVRKLFLQERKVNPYFEAKQSRVRGNLAFGRHFLKPKTIGFIQKSGYRMCDKQSAIALQWLTFEEEKQDVRIEHAVWGKEVKLNRI